MTGPVSLDATADDSIEESVQHEREAMGDLPDTGGLVPSDDAQSAPPPDQGLPPRP